MIQKPHCSFHFFASSNKHSLTQAHSQREKAKIIATATIKNEKPQQQCALNRNIIIVIVI
jgi:hypothetical protein